MCPAIVWIERNSSLIGQSWTLWAIASIRTFQVLTVQVRITSLAVKEQLIVNDFLPIPPNTKQNLFDRQPRLGRRSTTPLFAQRCRK